MQSGNSLQQRKVNICDLDRGTCSCQYGLGFLTGCNSSQRCGHKRSTMQNRSPKEPYTAGKLLTDLKKIIEEHGSDMVVMFDVEAGKFDYHYAHVDGCFFLPEEHIGEKQVILTTHDPIRH